MRHLRMLLEWLLVALAGSGAAWLVARNVLAAPTEFGPLAPPWAARVLAIHGGIAMLALVTIGAWLPTHVLPRLGGSRGRCTGLAQLALLVALTATGFGLYYLADEASRPTWSAVHWVCGLALPCLLLVHRRGARHE